MAEASSSLNRLIEEFKKMPGIGPKSAQRLAFYILNTSADEVKKLLTALLAAKKNVKYCSVCHNLTDHDPCQICSDKSRDLEIICVVEEPKDLMAIERSKRFRGRYHVLGGSVSPLDGKGPEKLKLDGLLERVKRSNGEVLLAMNPTAEGEATLIYLTKVLKPLGVKLTRLASGLPIGADLDYADEATLSKAFEGRREVV